MLNFEINNLTESKIDKKFLEKVAIKTLNFLNFEEKTEVNLVIIGEARMRKLNKKYRKINRVTDVLAFDYGEIFICLPQARKQAKQLGNILKKELAILLIHGILHLAGYDDETKIGYNKMVKKQEEVWQKLI
ncbi:MAG: rRNA maturation RNase YbeY [Candidatus Omnitrophica bacterium]|nr:rRNA maturation RNase YbeY [Candidatus Omnitrophota bacterium]